MFARMLPSRLCSAGGGSSPSAAATPSSVLSPAATLSRQYAHEVHTLSFREIWSKIHEDNVHAIDDDREPGPKLSVLLEPNRDGVEKALRNAVSDPLTGLVSEYFDHSEHASDLCLSLQQKVDLARAVYSSLVDLLSVLPSDGNEFSRPQCDALYAAFCQFDSHENPFPSPDGSGNFDEVHRCSSRLETQLDGCLRKSHSKLKLQRRAVMGSSLCIAGTALAAIVTVALVMTHAVAAFVCIPCIGAHFPCHRIRKKELERVAQLKAAWKGTDVLHKYMDNLNCLVKRLHDDMEHDKNLVRIGLEGGGDRIPILLVMNDLRKNVSKFQEHLEDLEIHICLGFKMVNRLRQDLLDKICRQSSAP
ncbi:hypothetical protein MLD38_024559 [Melastoma candidum]|uniref:Uncharacterized protein n=1 Tax=Melastoma candidum TaxID=119954 RepID=A0ACB9NSR9_9MYRT|nr:hypothetical protein MLD38_024559 [Melastoma candidum]